MDKENNIVAKSQLYVEQLLTNELPKGLDYHNLLHTQRVARAAEEIGRNSKLDTSDMETVLLAAWFHDTGFTRSYDGHETESQKIAEEFLQSQNCSPSKIQKVVDCILATREDHEPSSEAEKVLHDADLYHAAQDDYLAISENLRQELATTAKKEFTDIDWYNYSIDYLLKNRFQSQYGQNVLEKKKKKVLKDVKKRKKKHQEALDLSMEQELGVRPEELKELKKKLQKAEGRPERGIETMFRLTSRNHLTLSGMADTKANIMISVNSIILSILIGALMQKLDNNPHLIVPTFIMLLVNLGSIIFAILSTRPNITTGKFTREDIERNKTNLLFFGNFHQMKRQDYQWGMHRLMSDGKFLYTSLIDDIFFLGVVLGRKYRFLRISYNIFMFGLVLAVVAFMVTNIIYGIKS